MRGRSKQAGSTGVAWRTVIFAVLIVFPAIVVISGGCGGIQGKVENSLGASSAGSSSAGGSEAVKADNRLMLGVMVHIEGWKNESQNRQAFEQHAAMVRQAAAVFENNGLRLTFEASPEFVRGCTQWSDNVLKELADKGHGVGVHADLGAEAGLTQQAFVEGLARMKKDIEALGIKVRHVSGVCSSLDWVGAARGAGFEFVSGTVEYALKSIPPERLPKEYGAVLAGGTPSELHGSVPYELSDRLHPWRMNSGADWLWENPQGKVVIIPGDGGTCIPNMAEEASGAQKVRKPSFSGDDISAFTREVDAALAACDPDRVNALYVGWSIGQQFDPATVESWAAAIKGYTDSGKVVWKTLPGMYDAFLAWEASIR